MLSTLWTRRLQYAFIAIVTVTVGFSLYQWSESRAAVNRKTASNNGLVGYWSFNEGTGTQTGDASGNNNTGTLTNGPTWVDGKRGKAVNFDGVNDYNSVPQNGKFNISTTAFSVSLWVKDDTAYAGVSTSYHRFISWYDGTNNVQLGLAGASNPASTRQYYFFSGTAGDARQYTSISGGISLGWHHVMATYNGTTYTIYVDGVASGGGVGSQPSITPFTGNSTTLYIGQRGDNAGWTNGSIDEVRIYNRALTSTEITNLYTLGAAKVNASQNSNLTNGLVGLWSFNGADISGTTAYDRSGSGNNGTLTNGPVITEGKLGQALSFDGADDVVSVPAATSINNLSALTVSAWINAKSSGEGGLTGRIVDKEAVSSGAGWMFFQTTGNVGGLRFFVVGSTSLSRISSNNVIKYNKWEHVLVTWDGSMTAANVHIYVNGVEVSYTTTTDGAGRSADTTLPIRIGNEADTIRTFDGSIDEVRVYNRVLSAGEIQSLYDLGSSDKVNSSVSQNQGTGRLDSGLAGYWKLDDATGTTATDSSTNANNGTLTNGPTWGTGQIGGDTVFDGTDDYVGYTSATNLGLATATSEKTICSWVKTSFTPATAQIIWDNHKSGAQVLQLGVNSSGVLQGRIRDNNSVGDTTINGSGAINNGQWHHACMTIASTKTMQLYVDGAKNGSSTTHTMTSGIQSNPLYIAIGKDMETAGFAYVTWNGSLDDVRIYDRALSDDEVSQLYRLTTPTGVDTSLKGYWSFNGQDLSGTTAYDRSGAGNTGTLTNGPAITEGKLGQALSFDGTNDLLVVNNSSSLSVTNYTASFWIKSPTAPWTTIKHPINLENTNGSVQSTFNFSWHHDNSAFRQACAAYIVGTWYGAKLTSSLLANTWYHIACTYNGSSIKAYLNGSLEATTSASGGVASAGKLYIGTGPSTWFNGSLDEVRIYNRALSSDEVASLYNAGR